MAKSFKYTVVLVFFISLLFSGCNNKKTTAESIAVFVPGVVSGSPVYEMLVAGVKKAVDEFESDKSGKNTPTAVDIIEAGTNQAEWGKKLTALAATGQYTLIISSNSSLPALIEPITAQFPNQKFLILDAFMEGNDNVATVNYNQREQSYLTGYAAGLITTSESSVLPYANKEKKIGLIAAQEYPVMNNVILPGFEEGAKAVDPEITVDFRIVGNWYDASKSAELARSMFNNGVDVILPISGGANQGIIAEAQDLNYYVAWFDDNGYAKAPGFVLSCSTLAQEKMAYEQTKAYLNGKVVFGTAKTVGVVDGYIDWISDDPLCIEYVPEKIRNSLKKVLESIKSGELKLPMKNY